MGCALIQRLLNAISLVLKILTLRPYDTNDIWHGFGNPVELGWTKTLKP